MKWIREIKYVKIFCRKLIIGAGIRLWYMTPQTDKQTSSFEQGDAFAIDSLLVFHYLILRRHCRSLVSLQINDVWRLS